MSGIFAPPPMPPRKPKVFVEPAEKAFHFEVPDGWEAEGSLKRTKPNGRYIVANMTGPGSMLVFAGHPDLPLRFAAPAPWHGYWPPGQRVTFNAGTPAEEAFLQSPLMNASNACLALANRRFGPCRVQTVLTRDDVIRQVAQGLQQAGGFASYIDACRAEIVSQDGQRAGAIECYLFGGNNPGETWQIENITGFWAPQQHYAAASAAYKVFMDTLKTGDRWVEDNRDDMVPGMGSYVNDVFRKADQTDRDNALKAAQHISATTSSMLDDMKKRH